MADDTLTKPEVGVMSLVGGIIADVHRLISQQLALFRHELQGDFDRIRDAGALLATGLVILVVGGVSLCTMSALLIDRILTDLPLWACYGVVGLSVSTLGATFCWVGARRLKAINTTVDTAMPALGGNLDG